jgi:hypothetical protein
MSIFGQECRHLGIAQELVVHLNPREVFSTRKKVPKASAWLSAICLSLSSAVLLGNNDVRSNGFSSESKKVSSKSSMLVVNCKVEGLVWSDLGAVRNPPSLDSQPESNGFMDAVMDTVERARCRLMG